MLAVEEALARVLAGADPVGAEVVSLDHALDRVLAVAVAARVTHPPVAVSAMDGYAARSVDLAAPPVLLRVVGEAAAGVPFAGEVGPGEAVRISTGAPVPSTCDAIVIQENTERFADGTVRVVIAAPPGAFIRPAGLDFRQGDVLLPAGRRLTPPDIGLAAAMNVPWLTVRRRPRIALVATGDELVQPGESRTGVQIVNSNGFLLAAFVRSFGGAPLNLGIAGDDGERLLEALEAAQGADLLVTLGGASVGDHDLVRRVLLEAGFDLAFAKVAMRPGKPLMFGRLGSLPVLALPGNPVSVGVTAVLFVRPFIERLLGLSPSSPVVRARLGRALAANDERQEYVRALLHRDSEDQLVATPFEQQDSAMLRRLAEADGLIIRPAFAPPAAAGAVVPVLPLRPTFSATG